MKKFLTVLLVIAVMFTFSFSSAFATVTDANKIESRTEALKVITDEAQKQLDAVDAKADELIRVTSKTGLEKEAYTNVLNDLRDKAKAAIVEDRAEAYNAFVQAENAEDTVLGYLVGTGLEASDTLTGYVNVKKIVSEKLKDYDEASEITAALTVNESGDDYLEELFDLTQESTIKAIQALDLTVYSTTAKLATAATLGTTVIPAGTTHYNAAVIAQKWAIAEIGGYKYDDGKRASDVTGVFVVANPGTVAEENNGTFGDFIDTLTKVKSELTVEKKIEYAKAAALAQVKSNIESEKASKIEAENKKIFAQEIAAKPNQDAIDAAKEAIENYTAEYDALMEVWTYRLTNAEYDYNATSRKVTAYYDLDENGAYSGTSAEAILGVGSFSAENVFTISTKMTVNDLKTKLASTELATAEAIAKDVDRLEKDAARLKATIAVDGNSYIDVDAALADALETVYMTGKSGVNLDEATSNYEAHNRIHELIGTTAKEVKVGDTKYANVASWAADVAAGKYDETKGDEVTAIVKEAKAALKACKTVEEADAAFLAAYAKFDAVMTDAEHTALFLYGGELYAEAQKAVAEVNAYAEYKVNLMGKDFGGNVNTLKGYFTTYATGVLYSEVYSAADLTAKVAEAKATIDTLLTKAEVKAKDTDLNKQIVAVSVPVKAADKDAIVTLYREVVDFIDYCEMTDDTYTVSATAGASLIDSYVTALAALEEDAMKDMVEALLKDKDVTLDEKAAVEELRAAVDAYKALYVVDLETEAGVPALSSNASWDTVEEFEDAIFALEVKAAEELIAALPVNATAAQVAEARAAVDALGFDGICAINKTLLTKLNKFEQDAEFTAEDAKAYVQDLSIKARSTKTSKGVKVTINANVQPLLDAGYTVEYKFYRSTKSNKNFGTAKVVKTENTYLNTSGTKGTRYYYKAKLVVKNAAGEVVATTPLTQCLYATRTF